MNLGLEGMMLIGAMTAVACQVHVDLATSGRSSLPA